MKTDWRYVKRTALLFGSIALAHTIAYHYIWFKVAHIDPQTQMIPEPIRIEVLISISSCLVAGIVLAIVRTRVTKEMCVGILLGSLMATYHVLGFAFAGLMGCVFGSVFLAAFRKLKMGIDYLLPTKTDDV